MRDTRPMKARLVNVVQTLLQIECALERDERPGEEADVLEWLDAISRTVNRVRDNVQEETS